MFLLKWQFQTNMLSSHFLPQYILKNHRYLFIMRYKYVNTSTRKEAAMRTLSPSGSSIEPEIRSLSTPGCLCYMRKKWFLCLSFVIEIKTH